MHPALSVVLVALALLLANANESDNEILSNEPNGDAVTSGEHVAGSEKNTNENADASVGDLFETAARSYLDEEWDNCVDGFHRAFERYKEYKSVVTKCRRSCRVEAKGSKRIFTEDVEDLHFYEKKIRETLCLMKCKQRNEEILGAAALKDLPLEVELKFVERRGYEYLHICLYQKKRYQDAANALFTFMILHPEHELSLKNLRFYAALPEVKENQVVNLEADPFLRMYVAGVSAYDAEDYEETVEQLENSLRAYLDAEENCRAYCEGPFNQGWFPEFTSSIANHFTYCLKCKRSCSHQLNNFNGEYQHDLLPSHYHYLQFAYFKLGKVKEACAAVESYLTFFPVDETNLHNKEYFLELPEVKPEYFKPREEALSYVKRQEYELRLLLYIQEEFAAIDTKRPVPPQEDKKKEDGVDKKEQQVNN